MQDLKVSSLTSTLKNAARKALVTVGLQQAARQLLDYLVPARRTAANRQTERLDHFRRRMGASSQSSCGVPGEAKRLIFNCFQDVDQIILQWPLIAAFRKNGYEPWALLSARGLNWLEDTLRLVGVEKMVYYEDLVPCGRHQQTQALLDGIIADKSALDLTYRDMLVGKYALSTFMRRMRDGDPDLTNPETRRKFANLLSEVLNYADAAATLFDRVQPAAALIIDRGYSPQGQFFDLMMARGAPCITWNSTPRNQSLMLKRYTQGNRDSHHSTLSQKSWNEIKSMPWTPSHWQFLFNEFTRAYSSGDWAGVAGTQIDKVVLQKDQVIEQLNLDPAKKTVIVFSHIFWDSTFFWGKDIFRNYEDWFRQTVRTACANSNLNWVFKVHPANAIKDRRDGYTGEHCELTAIREEAGNLPSHVKVINADSPISTISLFSAMDFCITVRGTVGIEAACRGVPVITAGTGRYDRKGFTIDPDTTSQYLELLAKLPNLSPMTETQTELACRFAYGIFLMRPLPLQSILFGYRKDTTASVDIDVLLPAGANPFEAPDIAAIANWLESGDEDFLDPGFPDTFVAGNMTKMTTNDGC